MTALQRQVTEAIERMSAATNAQLQKLTNAMTKPSAPTPPAGAEPFPKGHSADVRSQSIVPAGFVHPPHGRGPV